jgi:glycosyltransferase involved in cell wall biosynthesis
MSASTSTISSMQLPIVLPIGTVESGSSVQTGTASQNRNASRRGMLLVLPAPFCRQGDKFFFELQACNGIEQWADHFGSVVVVAPMLPDGKVEQEKNIAWRDTATLNQPERFELIPVPWAYSIKLFATHYSATRKLLADLIDRSQYLQFPLGGLFGDWGSVAALEAYRQHRAYAIHTDLVEDQAIRNLAQGKPWRTQIKESLLATLAKNYYGQVIQRSSLALLHGEDCYAAYSGLCTKSFLVHDTHTKPDDTITAADLTRKLKDAVIAPTLRICYTGRMVAMKAPLDWVRAIGKARELGANVQATWLGDGDLRQDMERLLAELGLEDCIELVGYEDDRHKVLQALRDAHLLMFTHVTPESPRCLIEAFVSGTAIVGYHSRYAESLTQDGGGALVPIHHWQQLGEVLRDLWCDRSRLTQMIAQAAEKRSRFNDQAVFQERSELIKQHLS